MLNTTNTIECPICHTPLTFDVYGLLAGQSYGCQNCKLKLSLSQESHTVLESAMAKLENLAQKKRA